MNKIDPNVYVIAGPNGAGKTTFAKQFLPLYAKCKNFVNADLIASGLAPFSPETAAIKAGRILLEQVRHLAEQKADFAFESTLSGTAYISFLKKLRSQGYVIHIFYLWVPKVELSLARIKERVAKGGHNVPTQDVKRRFAKSFDNFIHLYKPLANYWSIIDNAETEPQVIVRGMGQEIDIIDEILYESILKRKAS
jgi:predicted ABC-type ATPase